MKRFWIGVVILLTLLLTGSVTAWGIRQIHRPMVQQLTSAAQLAMAEDWNKAVPLAADARDRWQRYYNITAAFADHAPMEELDSLFAELMVYGQLQDVGHFSSLCVHLSQLAEAMAESHLPKWWNIL